MNPTHDPVTLALTGQMPLILLLAAVLALPVSLCLLKLYHRAVLRSMNARAAGPRPAPAAPGPPAAGLPPLPSPAGGGAPEFTITVLDHASSLPAGPEAEALNADVLRRPWRSALVHVLAGACYALAMAAASMTASRIGFAPIRFLMLLVIYAWPAVLTVIVVAAPTRRADLAVAAGYFLLLAAVGAVGIARSPTLDWPQVLLLWAIFNLPATVLLAAFLGRRVRAVGPLVLTFMIVAITGSQVAVSLVGRDVAGLRGAVTVGLAVGLDAAGTYVALVVLGFAVFGLGGWLALRGIRKRYERKKISDESITVDAIWLLFSVVYSIEMVFGGAAWMLSGLVAFLVYKAAVWAGLSRLRGEAEARRDSPELLFLRVFSLNKRSERMFDRLAMHWRHVGSIQLIAGPDLATTTIEPHEFLDFMSGKLDRQFIDGAQTLDLRMAEMDRQPDQDGRFRVNDFFCYDDTWRMVLSRLVGESDAVLMDLRGFSPENAGCIFEVNELVNVMPLARVVFVVDDTTDEPFLRQTLREAWERMRPASPNRQSEVPEPACLFRLTGRHRDEFSQLLRALCVAATTARSKRTETAPAFSGTVSGA